MTRAIRVVMVVAAFALAAPLGAQELLANPGFEEFGEDGVPEGWGRYGGGVPESRLEASEDAHSGERAVRLIDTGPEERDNRYATGVVQTVEAEPGAIYMLSVWLKQLQRNNDGAMNLQLRFLPGDEIHNIRMAPELGTWRKFTIAGRAPEGTEQARVYIYTMHYWTTEAIIDDASLESVDAETLGARYPLAAHGASGIEQVRELNLRTPVVADGEAVATIAVPKGDEYAALGDNLASQIEAKTGARPEVTSDCRSLVGSDGTIIALGNLNNNFIIERLYWNKYLQIDALAPGPGRYVLQTVHEPYNWPRGMNILVVGASDLDGLTAGVEDLVGRIPEGDWVLAEPLLVVSGAEAMGEEAAQEYIESDVDLHILRRFWEAVQRYRDTGDLAHPRRAKHLLMLAGERFMEDPHHHYTWPEETTSNMIGAMWDVLEEAPIFTDEERLHCTNVILNALYVLPSHTSYYGSLEDNDGIIWNHTTFPLLGIYWMARYFDRYYGDVDGKIALMLEKCAAAFTGQVKSWKPQEDSAGYVSIVPRHTIEYTLAENDYSYFENGNVLRHAEYEVGFCDNTGDAAGFGDSGYGHGVYARNLHWALWYYRDGRFLWWLDRVMEGGYESPYDPSVEPVEWLDLAGATVFELHPEVYRYTTERADYGGEPTPPNIPQEECFDKIAFRESLDMDAEYFLLDGYSRGKHLQYDGNSIIKYYADGQDWLIDGDYLVRNTTDHNGVSVIRGGRVAELIPSCAALQTIADLPSATLVETAVYDYNGVDWLRNIFWLKGEFVLVTDRMRANEADDYTFVGNWKTLAEGQQELTDGRVFSTVRRGVGGVGSRELITVTEPAEGVERAEKFGTSVSQLDTVLELPAGELEMTLFASGVSTGADSFYVSIDGGERTAFHIPIDSFGPSSRTWTKDEPTPNIEIAEAGAHRVTITLREGPGPMLDRILVRDAEGTVVAEVEAEEAPPLPEEMVEQAPEKRFFVKADGVAQSKLTGRINHVGRHITYMRQRLGGEMEPGEMRAFHTLFYNDATDEPKAYDLRRISDEAVMVTREGEPWLVVLVGDEAMIGGQAEMKMMAFTRDTVWGADVTDFRGEIYAEQPFSGELRADPPHITIVGPPELTSVVLGGMPFALYEGRLDMDLAEFGDAAAGIVELERLFDTFVARAAAAEGGAPPEEGLEAPELRTERALEVPVEPGTERQPVERLYPVDLDGDGAEELIVLRARVARAVTATGEELWSVAAGGTARSLAHADIDGDGALEVLLGADDEMIHVIDAATGQVERRHHCDIPLRVGRSSVRQPRVGALAVDDLDGDGQLDIIAGLMNANLVRYDTDFNLLWRFDSIEHGMLDMALHDFEGDGALEIAVANRYGSVEIFDAEGRQTANVRSELGDVQMAIGDLDGDGTDEVANGSSTGAFTCSTYDGPQRFEFPNYGFAFTELIAADLHQAAGQELAAASETGYVYVLDADGEVLAQRDFGDAVNDIALVQAAQGAPRVAVACDDGSVYLVNAGMELVGAVALEGRPLRLGVIGAGDGTRLLAATTDTVHVIVP
ncbi:MAG: VCBS repeat-containing protein [Armatimonadota bacterium]|nr:VCBS repeat-containing protein [Armatimonadota bacterium]